MSSEPQTSSTATRGPAYKAPIIPNTPSSTINSMLRTRCEKGFNNPIKAGIAFMICFMFTAINKVYDTFRKDQPHSHTVWMMSSSAITLGVILGTVVAYHAALAMAVVVHSLLYIGAWVVGLFALALGIAGMVFFDKDGKRSE
ncbi:unnamed protein product [Owenia fusiformis]|uniref:Transmembrane protein n=1 Tax=Owenia fusiformis TaxID=6347 RepID=A0A8S4NHU0_OWEFU|nr:unnamed protein product [Owenia fusiformis]